ncbi:hypothetical protein M5K25_019640 [Dendrobium thyrsiflorum]|uniref:MATH domain-containing protein n=1 Tax=Dendrobium thyrsiflorum TaxID=117978 RepID=A0ABD0UFA9_DENTH
MSGISAEEHEAGGSSSLTEGMSSGQRCQSIDSLAEWRSSEQSENGIPSTSPPFWDTDDDDDECGPKPSELHGKSTWKIENFRQLNKRELRSDVFEVGGYKWYILIYPQGCDVCNHLSLFLCVANHDKLLPGWSHFAQFTIAVVNKDPKKSKFSDTLHRFWKKEHDWGWKKFMEISKVYDGFVNDDNLVIKAEVQVIREKANRPFRCLDCQYRRELVRVYLSNVEQICRRFIEDRKNKLGKLIEDKMRWSSFHAFWTGIDQTSRRRMSRDKSDTILRVVVKHFFVEKEVTSTLVMDSLHSGLKALEHHSKNKKGKLKTEMEDSSDPMVRVEKDMFVLDDDVVLLLDRVASEPLPTTSLPPKDDKVSLNRAKEGSCCEEFNKESIERDERRLTELGRKTIEIFVVAHIFSSRIEVAYQEAVALKRQEELIREEEAAGQAEHELKAKRAAADKEKRKKKQPKPKRNNRKSKDQQRDLRPVLTTKERQPENSADGIVSCELSSNRVQFLSEKMDALEDASDVSYAGEDATEPIHPDLDDRDGSPVNWDTDASEVHPFIEARSSGNLNEPPEKRSPIIDDSSSTCSTDSVPSVVSSGPSKGFSGHNSRSHASPNRGKNPLGKALLNQESAGHFDDTLGSGSSCHGMEADAACLKHSKLSTDKHVIEKREESATVQKKIIVKDQEEAKSLSSNSAVEASSTSVRSGRKTKLLLQQPNKILESSTTASNTMATHIAEPVLVKEPSATNTNLNVKSAAIAAKSPQSSSSKSEAQRIASIHIAKSTTARPSSAPLIPAASRPTRPIISKVQTLPQLSRSVSAAGRLGIDPSPSTSSCVPQSYRNVIIGKTTMGSNAAGLSHSASVSFSEAPSTSSSQSATSLLSASMLPPTPGVRKEHQMNCRPTFTFGSVKPDTFPNHHEWKDDRLHQAATATPTTTTTMNGIERLEICDNQQQENQLLCNTPIVQPLIGGIVDEFPHIDIINDLLDEEQSIMGSEASSSSNLYYPHHRLHQSFGRQYTFPGDISSSDLGLLTNNSGRYEQTEQYYDDGYQNIYSSSSVSPLHRLREGQFPQLDLSASYAVGPMDGMVQIPWPYSHTDLSTVNLGSAGTDGYSYQQFSDYSSLGRGTNGYGMYRP